MSEKSKCEICGNKGRYKKDLCDSCIDRQQKINSLWRKHGKREQATTAFSFTAEIRAKLAKNLWRTE